MAPAAGFEPATKWLTATYSTAELCRSVISHQGILGIYMIFRVLQARKILFLKINSERIHEI